MLSTESKEMCHQFCWVLEDDGDDDGNPPDVDGNGEDDD